MKSTTIARCVPVALLVLALFSCGKATLDEGSSLEDLNASENELVLSADQIPGQLDADGLSKVYEEPEVFERLGFMIESTGEPTLQARLSADGSQWSDWKAPVITFHEGAAYNGHVDAPAPSKFFQFRVTGADRPSGLYIGKIKKIPTSVSEPSLLSKRLQPQSSDLGQLQQGLAGVSIVSRAAWGSRGTRCSTGLGSPWRMAVHHTAGSSSGDPAALVRQAQAYHMDQRGYCDIAYHLLISPDGRIFEGRPIVYQGGHTLNNNSGNVGLSVLGDYSYGPPSAAAQTALAQAIAWTRERFSSIPLDRAHVKGHREWNNTTACPGNYIINMLSSLVDRAAGMLGGFDCNAACGNFGCACVNGQCNGGYCPGTGCSASETAACAAYGSACVDHKCNGGASPGTGCTAKETLDCAAYGAGCVDHKCNGGTAPGTGCTWRETHDCAAFGSNCVDHKCNGGTAPGTGCTWRETHDCAAYGCECVDHQCNGGFCPGTGCTWRETQDCAAFGCGCTGHKCAGGFCG